MVGEKETFKTSVRWSKLPGLYLWTAHSDFLPMGTHEKRGKGATLTVEKSAKP